MPFDIGYVEEVGRTGELKIGKFAMNLSDFLIYRGGRVQSRNSPICWLFVFSQLTEVA